MKITKKAIKEAPKYIMCLDPKACGADNVAGFDKALGAELYYRTMAATNMLDAMTEAESYFNDTTYLITIAGKTERVSDEAEGIIYKEILTTRSGHNWHRCDSAHSETPFEIAYNLEYKFFQGLGKAE